ncbi:transcriptional regulator domain-containing protein [Novosphingobium aquimarinum]|uniref:transcriptional regulator domain-containing protein n=1 Tax=Novosphingobium aquimarinum TaxID=2682494 RepID=UPI0038CD1B65
MSRARTRYTAAFPTSCLPAPHFRGKRSAPYHVVLAASFWRCRSCAIWPQQFPKCKYLRIVRSLFAAAVIATAFSRHRELADRAEQRAPDGSDPRAYRWLASLDREGWAWEWLRRDPGYRGVQRPGSQACAVPLFLPAGSPDPHRGLLFRRGSHPLGPERRDPLRRDNRRMGAVLRNRR